MKLPEPLGVFGGSGHPFFFLNRKVGHVTKQQNEDIKWIVKNPLAGEFLLELAIIAEDFGSWMVSWRSWLTFVKGFSAKWH